MPICFGTWWALVLNSLTAVMVCTSKLITTIAMYQSSWVLSWYDSVMIAKILTIK